METYDKQADWVGALKETFWGILNIIYISTALACRGPKILEPYSTWH